MDKGGQIAPGLGYMAAQVNKPITRPFPSPLRTLFLLAFFVVNKPHRDDTGAGMNA